MVCSQAHAKEALSSGLWVLNEAERNFGRLTQFNPLAFGLVVLGIGWYSMGAREG